MITENLFEKDNIIVQIQSKRARSNGLLLLTAIIWGGAFVTQSVAMDYIGPFTFNAVRSFLGCLTLLPVIYFSDRRAKRHAPSMPAKPKNHRQLLVGGICCGTLLAASSSLQQVGITFTTVGKAGFITALYILIVPLIGLFLRKKASPLLWISVAIAVVGMYFLCITEGFSIGTGDLMMLGCAACFATHIQVVDHFSPHVDCLRMSCIQLFTCACISTILTFCFEQLHGDAILSATIPILYAGILSSGVAYTLQMVAQKNTDPTVASLLLSLESVFAVFAGWIILGQTLTLREWFGCALMFAAILLAQLPVQKLSATRRAKG